MSEAEKFPTPNQVLMNGLNKLDHVIVVGFEKGTNKIHLETSRPTFEFMNYLLNRAIWNINAVESNQIAQEERIAQVAAEVSVEEQVADNMLSEIKEKRRGRPRKIV